MADLKADRLLDTETITVQSTLQRSSIGETGPLLFAFHTPCLPFQIWMTVGLDSCAAVSQQNNLVSW